MTDADAVIEARDVVRDYREGANQLSVLRGVSLRVQRAEQVAIVGRSGSGKSTLLHVLGGLDKPSSGEIVVDGSPLSSLSPKAAGRLRNRSLGFVYQFHHLLNEFTALENVALPLLIRGERADVAERRAADYLDRVGLADRMSHTPSKLSGGERQRTAIARALVSEPVCVLADEPTGNLDDANADRIHDLLVDLNRELHTAFVIVTHDNRLAARLDRCLQLVDGRLETLELEMDA
ncbi:MAG: lipoprotein-releasing ABC transporter ATP-binding protein LolD [Pseudomonadota bacterium]